MNDQNPPHIPHGTLIPKAEKQWGEDFIEQARGQQLIGRILFGDLKGRKLKIKSKAKS